MNAPRTGDHYIKIVVERTTREEHIVLCTKALYTKAMQGHPDVPKIVGDCIRAFPGTISEGTLMSADIDNVNVESAVPVKV